MAADPVAIVDNTFVDNTLVDGTLVDDTIPVDPMEEPTPPEAILNDGQVIAAAGNAGEFQWQAEQAFREQRYEDAARLVNHAVVEDGDNGLLHLFASQALFAMGDYQSAAAAVQQGAALLDRSQWGFVVENFREFYGANDYVPQAKALVEFTKANPNESYAFFLLGYHYKFLGHDEAARKQLAKAVELESRDRLAGELLVMAGGQLPAQQTTAPDPVMTAKPPVTGEDGGNVEAIEPPKK